jgi:uncharacterized membrane protein (DUF4010 family)
MDQIDLFYRFGVAMGIGFLIGLQREFAKGGPNREILAGERTLALMGLLGCTAAMAADVLVSPWPFVVIIGLVGALIAVAYFVTAWRGSIGLTTEVAVLLTVIVGALCYWEHVALAVALAVTITVLLSLKLEMDIFVRRITREDIYATLKFAVITAIVLPLLPNRSFGPPPWDVLNPYKIWLMVVFISGISFLGYVLIKVVGGRRGIGLTGLLGGLVSSTAVTLSFSERSQDHPDLARPFALAITLAWTVMFGRVIVEVAVLNQELLQALWLPMVAAMAAGLAFCGFYYFAQRTGEGGDIKLANPFELGPAIKFGILYAVILIVAKAAQFYFQDAGLYAAAAVAGLADVDAITLSMAELAGAEGGVAIPTAARAVVLAAISNTLVKGGIALFAGAATLRRALLPPLLAILAVSAAVAFLLL